METYSIINDFSGIKPKNSQLKTNIILNTELRLALIGISIEGDNVNILFKSQISPSQKTILNNFISSYVYIYIPKTPNMINITVFPKIITLKNTSYTRIGSDVFLGSKYARAECISHMDSNVTSYTIQIFNKDDREILLSTTLTNTTESIQELGVLSNTPNIPKQIEILVKNNGGGGGKIYIERVNIYYT